MRRHLLGWSLLLAGIFCLLQQPMPRAYWQSRAQVATAASCSAPTLNGTAKTTSNVYTNPNVLTGLTTSGGNRLIYAVTTVNGFNNGTDTLTLSDATSGNVLSFSQRAIAKTGSVLIASTAVASGALTADVITATVTPGAGVTFLESVAIGIAGADTTTKFDGNASLPNTVSSGALSISTTHNCDFILGEFRNGGAFVTDAGWTNAIIGDFTGIEYLAVTSAQSGLTPTGGGNSGGIGDAVVSP